MIVLKQLIFPLLVGATLCCGEDYRVEIIALEGNLINNTQNITYGALGETSMNLSGDLAFVATIVEEGVSKNAVIRILNSQEEIIATEGPTPAPFRNELGHSITSVSYTHLTLPTKA